MRSVAPLQVSSSKKSDGKDLSIEIRLPWWIHPAWALLILTGMMAAISMVISAQSYKSAWNVDKFLTSDMALILTIGIASTFLGILISGSNAFRSRESVLHFNERNIRFLKRAYRLLFVLSIVGYVIWITSAIGQGVQMVDLFAVVEREEGAISQLKSNSRPIGGLTTLTQFAPVTIVVGLILRKLKRGNANFVLLILLAAFRGLFYAERLALVEVMVPVLLVAAITVGRKSRWGWFIKFAPLVIAPFIWLIFAASEFTRSWIYYQKIVDVSFVEWVTLRLLGYYVTSYNNSALFAREHPGVSTPPYFTVDAFWNAPGVSSLVTHPGISGVSIGSWWSGTLRRYSNPEFNNVGSFLTTYAEYGIFFMILYWVVCGFLIGLIYTMVSRGSVPALIAYSTLFVGLLELPRFIYWSQGRSLPIILAIIIIGMFFPQARRRIKGPSTSKG